MKRSSNATFITPNPKKKGAVEIKDSRPISQQEKMISKVIIERLEVVISKLVRVIKELTKINILKERKLRK